MSHLTWLMSTPTLFTLTVVTAFTVLTSSSTSTSLPAPPSSSAWTCNFTNLTKPSTFCAPVPVPPSVCTDDGTFDDNQRSKSYYKKQQDQCSSLKKKKSVCPNSPDLCQRDILNQTSFCGGHDQSCQTSSSCLSYCYNDCYPCNTRSDCDLLVGFGILALPNQTCFSLEAAGQGLLSYSKIFHWVQ